METRSAGEGERLTVAHTRKYSYINSDIFLQDTSYGVADLVMLIECAKAVHKSALFAIEGWGWKE